MGWGRFWVPTGESYNVKEPSDDDRIMAVL